MEENNFGREVHELKSQIPEIKKTPFLNRILNKLVFFLIIIGIFMMGIFLGIQVEKVLLKVQVNTYHANLASEQQQRAKPVTKCKLYGYDTNPELVFIKYIVKKGDTLTSVAQEQLGNSSRISDIIAINQSVYSGLSLKNPFIEQGWVLYLPPTFIKNIEVKGNYVVPIAKVSGNITSLENGNWGAYSSNQAPGYELYFSKDTEFFGKAKLDYNLGDCFTAVMQMGGNRTVYRVTSQ